MESLHPLLAVSCLCVLITTVCSADITLCMTACNTPPEKTSEGTMLVKHMCGCVGDSTFDPFAFLDLSTTQRPSTTTPTRTFRAKQTVATTTLKPESVTSICDYLCAHQMGGDACRCSNPSLPGK